MSRNNTIPEQDVISPERVALIMDQLWSHDEGQPEPVVYAILDGAQNKSIERMLNNSRLRYFCLYEGRLTYSLAAAAPYIALLEKDHPFVPKLLEQGTGNNWGVFAIADPSTSLASVRRNCRKIAYVTDEHNTKFVFRYYDPRVLRAYLPTCNNDEANMVFGPCSEFLVESTETGYFHRFARSNQGVIDLNNPNNNQTKTSAPDIKTVHTGLLKIRPEQLSALSIEKLKKSYVEIKTQFINDFIEDNAEIITLGDGARCKLEDFMLNCFKLALQFKLEDQYSIYSFFHLNYQHGWKFWEKEDNAWAKEILESPRKGDIKIEKLEKAFSQALMDQLWS